MLVPEKMKRLSVAILREDMEAVLEEIVRAGVLHLTKIEEIDEWAGDLKSVGVGKLSMEYVKRSSASGNRLNRFVPKLSRSDPTAENPFPYNDVDVD